MPCPGPEWLCTLQALEQIRVIERYLVQSEAQLRFLSEFERH